MLDLVIEMETGDPDDFLTFLRALDHPDVNLKAVVLNPGEPIQIGLIRWALNVFERQDILVGYLDIDNKNKRKNPAVSPWHYEVLSWTHSRKAQAGWGVLEEILGVNDTMFIGAPPRNLGELLQHNPHHPVGRFVIQGGFAGDSIVDPRDRLAKFEGQETCPTFNLNGHKKSTKRLLAHPASKSFVSKNVCHGILYDQDFHERLEEHKEKRQSLSLIHEMMEKTYIENKGAKALHDPFALCCAIDDSVADWKQVLMYKKKNEWGCVLDPSSNDWITVAGDKDKFFEVFVR